MASSSSSFLIPCGDGYRFDSLQCLRAFLHGPRPYEKCVGFAPRGKNAPYCSRDTGRIKCRRVTVLLDELLQATAISAQAGCLLKELSTHLVCGASSSNNCSYHFYQASQVYEEWCNKLWCEYLRVKGLDPKLWSEAPRQFTAAAWRAKLEEIQRAQSYESGDGHDGGDTEEEEEEEEEEEAEEEEAEEEGYDLDSESDAGECFLTPVTTITDFDESRSTKGTRTPPQRLHASDRFPRLQESPSRARQPSRSRLGVYHDPDAPRAAAQTPNLAQAGNRGALAPLDRNITVSRPGYRTLPSRSRGKTDASPSLSSISYRTEPNREGSGNAKKPLGIETSNVSSNGGGPTISDGEEPSATQEDVGESENGQGGKAEGLELGGLHKRDAEEHAQIGSGSAPGPASSESAEHNGADPSRGDIGEDAVRVGAEGAREGGDGLSNGSGPEEGDPARDGNGGGYGFAGDFPAAHDGVFKDADTTEATLVQTGLPPPPAALPPGFLLFCQAPRPRMELNKLLKTMTKTIPPKMRKSGFIYAFSRPSLPGLLKIGYVEDAKPLHPDPVDNRLGKWQADCGNLTTEVFRVRIACKAVERIENLVHRTLAEYRRKEVCSRCMKGGRKRPNGGERQGGKVHDEWFQVDEGTARRVVDRWALFARQEPYDQFGRMVDVWSAKVDCEPRLVREGDTTMSWLERMQQFVEDIRR